MMRVFNLFFALCWAAVIFMSGPAYAACSSPAGEEGEMLYNQDHKMMQFCDGTDWVAMGGISPSSGGEGSFSPKRIYGVAHSSNTFPSCAVDATALGCLRGNGPGSDENTGIFKNSTNLYTNVGYNILLGSSYVQTRPSPSYPGTPYYRIYTYYLKVNGATLTSVRYRRQQCGDSSTSCSGAFTEYNWGMCLCQED